MFICTMPDSCENTHEIDIDHYIKKFKPAKLSCCTMSTTEQESIQAGASQKPVVVSRKCISVIIIKVIVEA